MNVSIKSETSLEETLNNSLKKRKHTSEEASSTLDDSVISVKSEESPSPWKNKKKQKTPNKPEDKETEVNIEEADKDSPTKKRKIEHIEEDEAQQIKTGAKKKQFGGKQGFGKKSSESFTPFDYSQVDYKEYQQSGTGLAKRNSSDKFKHKVSFFSISLVQ